MKKIYDTIHKFIHISDIESNVIYSPLFGRLKFIHQLGLSFYVYPGAHHKRFEHSIGTMEVASRIFDAVISAFELEEEKQKEYRQILRLAALLHDLGHLPFSHVAEKAFLKDKSHEDMTYYLITNELDLPEKWIESIAKIAVGPHHTTLPFNPVEKTLSEIITGDFFGADRIDYLLRDAYYSGLNYGLFDFHQLIEMMRLIPFGAENSLNLGVHINGIESSESLLLARYFMHKRIYQHPSIKAYNFHMARFMEACFDSSVLQLPNFLHFHDLVVQVEVEKAAFDCLHPLHHEAKPFFDRKNRCTAIATTDDISSLFQDLRLGYEEGSQKTKHSFNFPVLKKDGSIESAANLISLKIPLLNMNWLYIMPNDEALIREKLSQ
ncbi:MAG: HD domain-containing protein [Simkaniaceae bacterium]